MKITALVLVAWSVCLIGCAARRVPQDIPFVVGLPTGGSPFVLPMPEDDTLGAVNKCMAKVSKSSKGLGGECWIKAQSLKAGKTKELDQNYKKVLIRVMVQ